MVLGCDRFCFPQLAGKEEGEFLLIAPNQLIVLAPNIADKTSGLLRECEDCRIESGLHTHIIAYIIQHWI